MHVPRKRGVGELATLTYAMAYDLQLMAGNGNSKGPLILPRPSNLKAPLEFTRVNGTSPSSSSSAVVDGRSQALKVHSQAEKRRRGRINEHLSTLRRMIPADARKMDKATLLGSVIDHVKDLKTKAADINQTSSIPAEINEVIVEAREPRDAADATAASEEGSFYVKASVCCDDRPDLLADLLKVFRGLGLRTVRADITSLGGRAKNVFVLRGASHGHEDACVSSLKESMKDALAKIASSDMGSSDASPSKRLRLLQSCYFRALPE